MAESSPDVHVINAEQFAIRKCLYLILGIDAIIFALIVILLMAHRHANEIQENRIILSSGESDSDGLKILRKNFYEIFGEIKNRLEALSRDNSLSSSKIEKLLSEKDIERRERNVSDKELKIEQREQDIAIRVKDFEQKKKEEYEKEQNYHKELEEWEFQKKLLSCYSRSSADLSESYTPKRINLQKVSSETENVIIKEKESGLLYQIQTSESDKFYLLPVQPIRMVDIPELESCFEFKIITKEINTSIRAGDLILNNITWAAKAIKTNDNWFLKHKGEIQIVNFRTGPPEESTKLTDFQEKNDFPMINRVQELNEQDKKETDERKQNLQIDDQKAEKEECAKSQTELEDSLRTKQKRLEDIEAQIQEKETELAKSQTELDKRQKELSEQEKKLQTIQNEINVTKEKPQIRELSKFEKRQKAEEDNLLSSLIDHTYDEAKWGEKLKKVKVVTGHKDNSVIELTEDKNGSLRLIMFNDFGLFIPSDKLQSYEKDRIAACFDFLKPGDMAIPEQEWFNNYILKIQSVGICEQTQSSPNKWKLKRKGQLLVKQ